VGSQAVQVRSQAGGRSQAGTLARLSPRQGAPCQRPCHCNPTKRQQEDKDTLFLLTLFSPPQDMQKEKKKGFGELKKERCTAQRGVERGGWE